MGVIGLFKDMHPWIWLKRIRNRCGYGVHSPFAFNFITYVVYQKSRYYAYEELDKQVRKLASTKGNRWAGCESRKLRRLLFRVANWAKPNIILDVGPEAASELFLKAARAQASYLRVEKIEDGCFNELDVVDFIYLHDYRHPDKVRQAWLQCLQRITDHSVCVVHGIGYSEDMKRLWKSMIQDDRTGISFDLYQIGILCFDRKKIKQHYIVNF